MSIPAVEDLPTYCLLVAVAFALGLAIKYLLQIAFWRQGFPRCVEFVACGMAVLLSSILAADALRLLDQPLLAALQPLPAMGVMAFAIISCLSLQPIALPSGSALKTPLACLLLGWSMAGVLWSSHRLYTVAAPPPDESPIAMAAPGRKEAVTDFVAHTDRGRAIPLLRTVAEREEIDHTHQVLDQQAFHSVIVRATSDVESNCHGWVFTAGRFLLSPSAVNLILEDNGYRVVETPAAGDVIVYRGPDKSLVHTGLVQSVLEDGTVLVESKWGISGRYLHRPYDQPYSRTFAYYRSSRRGHLVTIRESSPGEQPVEAAGRTTSLKTSAPPLPSSRPAAS